MFDFRESELYKRQNGSLTSFDMKAPLASKVPKEATSSTQTVHHSGRSET